MWLAVAFVIGLAINMAMVPIVGTSADPAVNDFSRTYLPYWGAALLASGVAAGAVGLVAIAKDKERSIITILTLVPMLLVAMLLIGELLFPH